ncbi:hypothetical protein [Arenimonas sp.]|uniref:hypothetical protein n=1 Tax=Arenimonas sp. TaxID=1872635 RepID=UPI0035B0A72F
MSTLNKKTLALALVAALGAAGTAAAYDLDTTGAPDTPVLVATADIAGPTTVVGVNEPLIITLGDDTILGRTTGFSIRIELSNGAEFAAGFTGTSDPLVNADTDITMGPGAPGGWTATLAAGGAGESYAVLSINPPSTVPVPGLVEGELLRIDAAATVVPASGDGFELTNLAPYLTVAGREITATSTFRDPVSGNEIFGMGAVSTPVLRSGNPLVLGCDETTAAEPNETIDVGVTDTQASKTYFSSTGEIGLSDNGIFNAGSVTAAVAAGFGSFQYLATDSFRTTVTGLFSAFDSGNRVFLATDPTCATALVTGVPNLARTEVVFNYTGADLGANFSAAGFDVSLCFEVAPGNTQVIDASGVSVVTRHTRGTTSFTAPACDLLPLVYNGSVVKVATFNPGANATAQSFLRVTNPSSTAGQVTIEAWDDAGVKAPNVTFNLGAGVSRQINSDVIEAGGAGLTGALGDGAGKWRFLVTGEFAGMRVQSLNRNNTDGTVTNLTDYDTNDEQNKTPFLGTLSTYEGSDPN